MVEMDFLAANHVRIVELKPEVVVTMIIWNLHRHSFEWAE